MGPNAAPLLWIGALTGAAVVAAALLSRSAAPRRAFLALDRGATGLAALLACLALAVATFAGLWQVVSRFATSTPAVWSEALVRTALIWMTLLGLAAALRGGALVSIDVVHRYSPPSLRRALETLSLAGSLALMGILFWFGWTMAGRVRFQEMAGLEVSIAWGYAAIPIGAAFSVIGAIAHYLDRRSDELEAAV